MATGRVTITQENNFSGGIADVERRVLFIGQATTGAQTDAVLALNAQSDLDAVLGNDDSELKTNIDATRLNAGSNFTAWAIALGNLTWEQALELALDAPNDLNVELVALTTPITDAGLIDSLQAAAISAKQVWAKLISFHVAVPGIDAETQSWAEYETAISALQVDKVANRVCLVPQLHGNNLGVVIGRLCNDGVSLADSPMRVRTGSVEGLGDAPVDKDGHALTMAHLEAMALKRFSVPQWYTGRDGIFWADHMTLDAEGGDFQVFENLRVIDYVTRRVRLLAIQKIADRSLNSSESSTAFHQGYFMQPIFDASKTVQVAGEVRPGMVQPPVDGDMIIHWNNAGSVDLFLLAAPVNSPKKIGAHIALDLNRLG